jgi:pimeloyl-ACP methyl ester carboxylesterase
LILESVCACFRERLADPTCFLSPFHPMWKAKLAEAGMLGASADRDARAGVGAEWADVPGVGSVFRRRGGSALLVSPFALSPEMRRAMPALWAFDARDVLPTVKTPTLVLCGTADPVVPLAHARAAHELISGSDFIALEGAGHVPVAEGHAEVPGHVQRFLRERVARR